MMKCVCILENEDAAVTQNVKQTSLVPRLQRTMEQEFSEYVATMEAVGLLD